MRKRYLQRLLAPLCATALLSAPAAAQMGAPDASFTSFPNPGSIHQVVSLPDDKVLLGGSVFYSEMGMPLVGVTRLKPNGAFDSSWNGAEWVGLTSPYPAGVQHLVSLPNGNYLAAGTNGANYFVVRGDVDGGFDPTFIFNPTRPGALRAMGHQSTGRVILGGIRQAGTSFTKGIAALAINGAEDPGFATGAGISLEGTFNGHTVAAGTASVTALLVQPDDKIIIAGNFTHYDGVATGNVVRLHVDGSLDNTFNAGYGSFDPHTGTFGAINALALDEQGNVLAGGELTYFGDGNPTSTAIVRLSSTGVPDAGFTADAIAGVVRTLRPMPGQRTLVGGDIGVLGAPPSIGVGLLNPDGSVDLGFNANTGTGFLGDPSFQGVSDIDVTAGLERIYVAGSFTVFDGQPRKNLLRLLTSGSGPALPANGVICAGASVPEVNLGSIPPGTSVSWTNSNPSIGLAASGSGYPPAFTAVNNGSAPVTATITMNISDPSVGYSKNIVYRITVKPVPTVAAVADRTFCTGANGLVAFSGSLAGTTYGWTNNNTAIGLPASGTNNLSFTALNPANTMQSATITVTPVKEQCAGTPVSFGINVSPSAGSIAYPQSTYCPSGSAFVQLTGASRGGSFSVSPGGLSVNVSTGQINLAASPAGTYTVTYTVAADPACSATASTQVTVFPQTSVNPVSNKDFCVGNATAPVAFTGTATGYSWTNSNPAIGLAASGTGTGLPSFTPTATGSALIRVTPLGSAGNCPGKVMVFAIRVASCTVTQAGNTAGDEHTGRSNLLSLSPNPAAHSTMLQYNGTEAGPFVVEVVNAFGQPALRPLQVSGKTARLDLSGLLPGVYGVRFVNSRSGVVCQKQVIKL